MSGEQSTESDQKPDLLHALVLGSLISWAGEVADLDDCREIAEYLTPRLREFIDQQPAPYPHGVAWEDRLNIVCLCGKVCSAVIRKNPAGGFIGRPGSDTYVDPPAAQVFANHLREMTSSPGDKS